MKTLRWMALGSVALATGIGVGAAYAERGDGWHDRGHGRYHGRHHGGPRGERGERGRGRWFRGGMTKDQAAERARARFARIDANGDGKIDREEISSRLTQRMEERGGRMMRGAGRRMRRWDENRDGNVTREEFNAHVDQRFARMDLDSDGQITDADLPPMMRGNDVLNPQTRPMMGRRGAGRHHGHRGRRSGRRGQRQMGRMIGMLRRANANGDNVVTKEEVTTFAAKQFARLDRNGDGTLNADDRAALRKEMVEYRTERFLHRFGARDAGEVDRETFLQRAADRFDRRDVNGDGVVNRRDYRGDGRGRGRGEGRGGRRGGPSMDNAPEPDANDTDDDATDGDDTSL